MRCWTPSTRRSGGGALPPGTAGRSGARAGEQAFAAAAFEDALRLYDDAFSLLSTDDRRGRADLLYKRGHALRSLGRWDQALADWGESLSTYEGLGDPETVGRVCWEMSWQLAWTNRTAEGEAVARRGLAALGEQASADRCRLLAVAGVNLSLGADHAGGDGLIAEALEMAEALRDQRLLGQILTYKTAHHYYFMQMPETVDTGLRAAELLRPAGGPWDVAHVVWYPPFAPQTP